MAESISCITWHSNLNNLRINFEQIIPSLSLIWIRFEPKWFDLFHKKLILNRINCNFLSNRTQIESRTTNFLCSPSSSRPSARMTKTRPSRNSAPQSFQNMCAHFMWALFNPIEHSTRNNFTKVQIMCWQNTDNF